MSKALKLGIVHILRNNTKFSTVFLSRNTWKEDSKFLYKYLKLRNRLTE